MSKHNDTINALKRLERAGDASSEATAKLIEAAKTLLGEIDVRVAKFFDDGKFPLGLAQCMPISVASAHGLYKDDMLAGDRYWRLTGTPIGTMAMIRDEDVDRRAALMLAEAVADGLMDSLAEWAESRVQAALSGASTMGRAAAKV